MQTTKQAAEKLSTNNLLLILLLVSLLIVGTTVLVAKTLVVGIIRDTKVLRAENKANDMLDKDFKAAPDLVNSFQNLGTKASTLADALPNDANFPGLIVAMENIASDATITLKSVSPTVTVDSSGATSAGASGSSGSSNSVQPPKPQPYAFTIAFDGSYTSLTKLFADLELYDRPMRVQNVKLTGTGSALSGTIDVQTYYQDKAALPFATENIK